MGTEGTLTLKLRAVLEAEQKKPWCVPKGSAEGSREMLRWEAAVSRGCLQGNAPWACGGREAGRATMEPRPLSHGLQMEAVYRAAGSRLCSRPWGLTASLCPMQRG